MHLNPVLGSVSRAADLNSLYQIIYVFLGAVLEESHFLFSWQ